MNVTNQPGVALVWADTFDAAKPVFFDTETTGLNPRTCKLVSVMLWQEGREVLVLDYRGMTGHARSTMRAVLQRVFDAAECVVGHNLKFDMAFMLAEGVRLSGKLAWDTKVAQQLIVGMGGTDAAAKGIQFTLAATYRAHTGKDMPKEARSWFIDLDQRPEWRQPFPDEQLTYMAHDVEHLLPIYLAQQERVKELGLGKVAGLEMRVVPALAAMEMAGVRIDPDGWRAVIAAKAEEARALEAQAQEYFALPILRSRLFAFDAEQARLEEWERAFEEAVAAQRKLWEEDPTDDNGDPQTWAARKAWFVKMYRDLKPKPAARRLDTTLPNIGSSDQLLAAFHLMGILAGSTDSEVLGQIDREEVRALLAWRKAIKFVQSFGETLLAKVEADGRIHPDYQQIGASTGRMSCTHPNWQQVPARGDGAKLRACVVPEPGSVLVTADFSNIELRILASLSKDKTLIRWFSEGLDMHAELAYRVFKLDRSVDVAKAEFTPGLSYRQLMKTINYGLVYGMSAMKLSRTAKVTVDQAEAIMADYFRELPGVQKWLADQQATALQGVEPVTLTASGRRRTYHVTTAELRRDRKALGRVQRQAKNTPIQGLSADITKLAVALFHERVVVPSNGVAKLVAVVHDELVVECPAGTEEDTGRMLAECMDIAQRYFVKLPAAALPRPVAVASSHWEH